MRKRKRRTRGNKVFKLLIARGRNTTSSKNAKTVESDRVTGKAERWRSWRRGIRGVRQSCSEDFN